MPKESIEEIDDIMKNNEGVGYAKDQKPCISNHTGYYYEGGENFEHDDTGSTMNHSGVVDDCNEAEKEHAGWQEDYDY